jgi:transcriptional regulator with XRE-family HTH domain
MSSNPPSGERYNEAAAATLRSELAIRKLSGRNLAEMLAASPASTARLLSGERRVTVSDVAAVAIALAADPKDLMVAIAERGARG